MRQFSFLVAGIIGAVLLSSCGSKPATDAPADAKPTDKATVSQPGVNVSLATIQQGTLSGTISTTGSVVADANGQASLAFPVEGQIADVRVNVGDRFGAGDTLAALDSRLSSRAVAQASADVTAAQASLGRARAGARPQEFAQNEAALRAVQTRVQTARAELERQQSLANVGIAARRDIEQAKAAYADALADAQTKEQAGSLLRAGPRPQDVAVAQAQLQQAVQALATARTRASLGRIVAPFDGVVTARLKNAGEVVDPNTPVLTILNPARTVVVAQLSEDQAATVRPGDMAKIVSDARPGGASGVVLSVGAAYASDTRTVGARIRPLGIALLPGTGVRVRIITRTVSGTAIVPESAVVKDPDTGQSIVFIPGASAGTYRRVQVQIVLQEGSQVAVRSLMLRPGGRVVSHGAYELLPYAGGSGG